MPAEANPYRGLPATAFWRTAVAEPAPLEIGEVWQPAFALDPDRPILTLGSCFARHIGRALLELGFNWFDAQPAPPGLTPAQRVARQFGIFSFRVGNIYTAALLRQWFEWAAGTAEPPAELWCHDGRYFDPFRPSVEPDGYTDAAGLWASRAGTLAAIRRVLPEAGCLIFTLGLTESWHDRHTGAVYPMCPGTVRGTFEADRHELRNARADQVAAELSAAFDVARRLNPDLSVILTVSPQGLTATATGQHALVANTYTKSALRAAAGQLAAEHDWIDYFPSYELITGLPFRGRFFQENLRTVTAEGIRFVMDRFGDAVAGTRTSRSEPDGGEEQLCDDLVLDYYNPA